VKVFLDFPDFQIETIVCIFDTEGDRRLNYEEFVSVLRNRKRRRRKNAQVKSS
jgi:hypothetical protein